MGQMAKFPRHFFKIPWLFPDLEKILFFPNIPLTCGNPVIFCPKYILHWNWISRPILSIKVTVTIDTMLKLNGSNFSDWLNIGTCEQALIKEILFECYCPHAGSKLATTLEHNCSYKLRNGFTQACLPHSTGGSWISSNCSLDQRSLSIDALPDRDWVGWKSMVHKIL